MMIRNHYDEEHEAFRGAFRTFLEREAIPTARVIEPRAWSTATSITRWVLGAS
jgi:hypothetical protein